MSAKAFGRKLELNNLQTDSVPIFGRKIEQNKQQDDDEFSLASRAVKGFAKGSLGTAGDILDLTVGQNKQNLPGRQARSEAESQAQPEDINALSGESDITPEYSSFPSSHDIGKFIKFLGGPGDPKGFEQKIAEYVPEFIGSIISTGGILPAKSLAGAVGRTVLGGLLPGVTKAGVEEADLPPWAQAASTIAAGVLAHRITGKTLAEINKETYAQAFKNLPEDAVTSAKKLGPYINGLEKELLRGGKAPSEKAVLDFLGEIKPKIVDGKINVNDAVALKRSLNEINLANEVRKSPRARTLLKGVSSNLDDTIKNYGQTNEAFYKPYIEANSAHRGMSQSKAIEKFLMSNPVLSGASGIVGKLLLPSVSLPIASGIGAAAKTTEMALALGRNPGLRQLYLRFLKDAAKEEVRPTLLTLKKFNKKFEEEYPELVD